MVTLVFFSLFCLLQMSLVSCLPIVDPGLFVIMGVRSCRSGNGYCMLGLDCTLDEDFLPDDEGGHCDGLRSAFTPSAHFICCRYNAINKTDINLPHIMDASDISSTLSQEISTFTFPAEVQTTTDQQNTDIPTSTLATDTETTELSLENQPIQARIEPDNDNELANINTVKAEIEIRVNDKKDASRERNVDDLNEENKVETRTEVTVSSTSYVTESTSVENDPTELSENAYEETSTASPVNANNTDFAKTLTDIPVTSMDETSETSLPENIVTSGQTYPTLDIDNSLFPVTTQKLIKGNNEKPDIDGFKGREENEITKQVDEMPNKNYPENVSGDYNDTNRIQEEDAKLSSGSYSQSSDVTNPSKENSYHYTNKDSITTYLPASKETIENPTTPQNVNSSVKERDGTDVMPSSQHDNQNKLTSTEVKDVTKISPDNRTNSSQNHTTSLETGVESSLKTQEHKIEDIYRNTIPSVTADHTESGESQNHNPEQQNSNTSRITKENIANTSSTLQSTGITSSEDSTSETYAHKNTDDENYRNTSSSLTVPIINESLTPVPIHTEINRSKPIDNEKSSAVSHSMTTEYSSFYTTTEINDNTVSIHKNTSNTIERHGNIPLSDITEQQDTAETEMSTLGNVDEGHENNTLLNTTAGNNESGSSTEAVRRQTEETMLTDITTLSSTDKTTGSVNTTPSANKNLEKSSNSTSAMKTTEEDNSVSLNKSTEKPINSFSDKLTEVPLLTSSLSEDNKISNSISSTETTDVTSLGTTTDRSSSDFTNKYNNTPSTTLSIISKEMSSDDSTEISSNTGILSSNAVTESHSTSTEVSKNTGPDSSCKKVNSQSRDCWMVHFMNPESINNSMCVGSYLNSRTIVTSANCLSRMFDFGIPQVRLQNAEGTVIPSDMIYDLVVHEEYRNKNVQVLLNDIGLVRLKPESRLPPGACTLCLPLSEQDLMDMPCDTNHQDDRYMIGSPMICDGTTLAGIASSYNPHPVYTPISDYLTWIRTNQIVHSNRDGKWK
ncbi:hypothetical protein L9F63_005970 [Diploptera punctata]|uniref:Peptidase S1 domain-containing protein n=1 Tax=Diploptera punctata TaxID=6984 RepID=A0AAD8E5F3_DIPPU|nr:hypothetical protein L9F63_005970 [Diploptera punctata]